MKLYLDPVGGMCNRILAMSATEQLCRDMGCDYEIIWRNNGECACDFEDLFADRHIKITDYNLPKGRIRQSIKRSGFFQAMADRMAYHGFEKTIHRLSEYELSPRELPENKEGFAEIFREITRNRDRVYIRSCRQYYGKTDICETMFAPQILERANRSRAAIGDYIAFHIRRTDNIRAIEESPTRAFMESISEEIKKTPGIKIYVATDDDEIYKELRELYPDNIIDEDIDRRRYTRTGMQDAAYELLMLAGARIMYGSKASTYTDISKLLHEQREPSIGNNSSL